MIGDSVELAEVFCCNRGFLGGCCCHKCGFVFVS